MLGFVIGVMIMLGSTSQLVSMGELLESCEGKRNSPHVLLCIIITVVNYPLLLPPLVPCNEHITERFPNHDNMSVILAKHLEGLPQGKKIEDPSPGKKIRNKKAFARKKFITDFSSSLSHR